MTSTKNIVVVGTGGGGLALVVELQKKINPATHRIVVIEKRDYYPHWPALIRAAVTDEGAIDEASLIPNDRVFDPTKVRVVRSTAKSISSSAVTTESDESIPYEHLVLATGSIWTGPMNLPDTRVAALEHLRAFKQELKAAQHILIIGGGTSGLEYAGEIRHYHPDKRVTIVHGGMELMNNAYPTKFRKSTLNAMRERGVEVIFGDKILSDAVPEGGHVTTAQGKQLRADLVVNAVGGRLNTDVVKTLDRLAVTSTGTVLVTPELNVKLESGAKNVWALGDIIEWPEQKMVFKAARAHAPTVLRNLLASIQGGRTAPYTGYIEAIAITLGPKGGRGFLPFLGGIVLGDWMVSRMKSRDLRIPDIKVILGY